MRTLDTNVMSSAVRRVVSFCGAGVLEDTRRFQAAIMDVMPGSAMDIERQLLVFAVRIGIGKQVLEGVHRPDSVQRKMSAKANNILTAEYGFAQERSENILKAFADALWTDRRDDTQGYGNKVGGEDTPQGFGFPPKKRADELIEGAVIPFGKYMWRVLCVKEGTALLLAEEITDVGIPYNKEMTEISWEESWVRMWLNTEFLRRFSPGEQRRIQEREVRAENNPWYQTYAGRKTRDKVFLLSIADVVRNFGDSGQLERMPEACAIDDQYNDGRRASYKGEPTWWWLRSPGDTRDKAAYVNAEGIIYLNGELVIDDGGPGRVDMRPGIRPAIWLGSEMREVWPWL